MPPVAVLINGSIDVLAFGMFPKFGLLLPKKVLPIVKTPPLRLVDCPKPPPEVKGKPVIVTAPDALELL